MALERGRRYTIASRIDEPVFELDHFYLGSIELECARLTPQTQDAQAVVAAFDLPLEFEDAGCLMVASSTITRIITEVRNAT
jgi:hypothetical protein